MKEKGAELSVAACQALGATLDPSAAVPLAGPVGPRAAAPRRPRRIALARLGPAARPAMPALIESLKKDKEEGQLARAVLERLGETAVPTWPKRSRARTTPSASARPRCWRCSARALPAAAKALAARLADEKPAVALAAAQALVRVDPAGAAVVVAPLGKLLASKDVPDRRRGGVRPGGHRRGREAPRPRTARHARGQGRDARRPRRRPPGRHPAGRRRASSPRSRPG